MHLRARRGIHGHHHHGARWVDADAGARQSLLLRWPSRLRERKPAKEGRGRERSQQDEDESSLVCFVTRRSRSPAVTVTLFMLPNTTTPVSRFSCQPLLSSLSIDRRSFVSTRPRPLTPVYLQAPAVPLTNGHLRPTKFNGVGIGIVNLASLLVLRDFMRRR
jgi:hypothetical protein